MTSLKLIPDALALVKTLTATLTFQLTVFIASVKKNFNDFDVKDLSHCMNAAAIILIATNRLY